MRERGRGEERDTTTHFIKIQVFLPTLVVLLNLAQNSHAYHLLPCGTWQALCHVHTSSASRWQELRWSPSTRRSLPVFLPLEELQKFRRPRRERGAYTFHDALSQNGYNFLAKDDGHEPLSGGKQV